MQMELRNRSWEMVGEPENFLTCSWNQPRVSRSRWLVGSSSISRSGSITRRRAKWARIIQPPLRVRAGLEEIILPKGESGKHLLGLGFH